MQTVPLCHGWELSESGLDDWMPVYRVPTSVHRDLQANKRIPDPQLGFNEAKIQWVGEKAWTYRTRLPAVATTRRSDRHVLVFDGLDTFASIKINGKLIQRVENMFVPLRLDVTDDLTCDQPNTLTIDFASALLRAREIKKANPDHKFVGGNGEMARLAVRKAQYHWGWDWGPILMQCGPWRPIRLETYSARICDLHVQYKLNPDLTAVTGSIYATIEGPSVMATSVAFAVYSDLGTLIFKERADVDKHGKAHVEFHVSNPRLWYPHGYGEQSRYRVCAWAYAGDGTELHTDSRVVGFREAKLIQEKDSYGKSFFFRVNGIDVFAGGVNWIPADSCTPDISLKRYKTLLATARDGGHVMIRIWGGGIWEEDVLYDTCDELGLVVWQDFMHACGDYGPCTPEFLQSLQHEAAAQLTRLRHHPCIIMYAGNNEDYDICRDEGLTYDPQDKDPQSWLRTDFPARYVYEKLYPDAIKTYCPNVAYHPGSPWNDGFPTVSSTSGDIHQWNVYHGKREKYQLYHTLSGRFVSEFGMVSLPHIQTIEHFVSDLSKIHPQSRELEYRDKASAGVRTMSMYLTENLCASENLTRHIYASQLVQAEALSYAYRGWRRQWGTRRTGRSCGGALVWQFNDVWPGISWSIVDYFLHRKPAYYTAKRALAPLTINVRRELTDWTSGHTQQARTSAFAVWIASSEMVERTVRVEVRFIAVEDGQEVRSPIVRQDLHVNTNGVTEVLDNHIDDASLRPFVIAVRMWADDKLIARDADWPQPLKYLDMKDRKPTIDFHTSCVRVSTEKPIKGLVFSEIPGVTLHDNALDVLPGDDQLIRVEGSFDVTKYMYCGM